jgi:hypothetical protein
LGYEHEGPSAPLSKAFIQQTTDATGYTASSPQDFVTITDPAVYDTQLVQQEEADRYARDLQLWIDQGDGGPSNEDFDYWFKTVIKDEDHAKRVFKAMHDLNPDFSYWMSAAGTRWSVGPFSEYVKWAMKYSEGGTGTGNIVNAVKDFTARRDNSELDLAYDVWLGDRGLGATNPTARERFYDKATAMYGNNWMYIDGTRNQTKLVQAINNANIERGMLYLNSAAPPV